MRFLSSCKEEDSLEALLSPLDRELVEDVCNELDKELDNEDLPSDGSFGGLHRVPIIESNLRLIIRELKTCRKDRPQFVRRYSEWRTVRGRSIEALESIGSSIGKDRKNCNISRLVGNCTSLVGGGILVASAALIPLTLGLSTPLAIAGGVTTVLGSATSVGTSVAELSLLKTGVQKAASVLEEDRAAFKLLESRLSSDSEVSRAVDRILAADPDDAFKVIFRILEDFLDSLKSVHHQLERHSLVRVLVRSLIDDWSFVALVPCVVEMLLVLALCLKRGGLGGDRPWETLVNRFTSAANVSLGLLGPLATTLFKGEVAVAQCTARAVARGVIGVVGMTLDAASIVLTSIDVHKGSVSEEGSKILSIACLMREEAALLDEAYGETLEF